MRRLASEMNYAFHGWSRRSQRCFVLPSAYSSRGLACSCSTSLPNSGQRQLSSSQLVPSSVRSFVFGKHKKDDRLSSSWLAFVTHCVGSTISCVFKIFGQPQGGRISPCIVEVKQAVAGPTNQVTSRSGGVVSIFQKKRLSTSGTPILADKIMSRFHITFWLWHWLYGQANNCYSHILFFSHARNHRFLILKRPIPT